jgi:DNA replication protein DnaC
MLTHPTIEKLQALHLAAMAHAFEQQRGSSQHATLSFEDRLGLLVEAEWTAREQRRLTQRLRNAKLRYPASLEDVDFTTPRGLTREAMLSLGTGAWIRERHNLLITGPTGIGKSWLASAFVESACRHGFTATYVRAPRLLHDLAVAAAAMDHMRGCWRRSPNCSSSPSMIGCWHRSPRPNGATSSKSSRTAVNEPRR